MRTIRFRGKRMSDGEWLYGYLNEALSPIKVNNDVSNLRIGRSFVRTSTIGQFTSLYDKNGKEIYEGDILKAGDIGLLEVRFVRGVFAFLWNGNLDDEFPTGSPTHEWAEVAGNIHDNPKLLKKGE